MRNLKPARILSCFAPLACAGLMLSACVSVLPKPAPAPTVYRLTVPEYADRQAVVPSKVINIEYPLAPRPIGGADIMLSSDNRSLTAAANAHWAEPVPDMIRNTLIDALAANSDITGVIPKGSTRVPFRLNTDVRRFEAVFDRGPESGPLAIVQLNLSLTGTKSRNLISTRTIRTEARASTASVSAIVSAQEAATLDATRQITQWLDSAMSGPRG